MPSADAQMQAEILRLASPLSASGDLDRLIERVAGADVVMLGEATHGTMDFYRLRTKITQRLITNHGFGFVAVEGDWPDAAMIDRYVRDAPDPDELGASDGRAVLSRLDRWPTWMWANEEVAELIDWMHRFNDAHMPENQVRFHGLDIYSLYKSITEVLAYLESVDSGLAIDARERYACFELHRPDEIAYARSTLRFPRGCEVQAVENLLALLELRLPGAQADGLELFDAQQNARVVRDADSYYRTMLHGDVSSWNIRDEHMLETLELLLRHGGRSDGAAPRRGIVWAHNTHIGDYRATDMASHGYVNLGGLARERFGDQAVALVGFGTFGGHVVASTAWDGPTQRMAVPPARAHSYEAALHAARGAVGADDMVLVFDEQSRHGPLASLAGHRAIGVVYDPRRESRGSYVPTVLADRYDAFVYVDHSDAVHPLAVRADVSELPETYPTGV